jgi:type IV pilus assembly protein PilY1
MIASLHAPPRRRLVCRAPLGIASTLALLSASTPSLAQSEAQKPAPNVLLLVDSSGSMEFKTDGVFPTCDPGSATSQKSRWIDLVEVLTGNFENYSCWAQNRSDPLFRSEFSLAGVSPYDYGYVNPYHRALSNGCLYGPGVVPPAAAPYSWPTRAVNTFELNLASKIVNRPAAASLGTHPGCAGFSQTQEGLLDIYKDMIRFGLMTFDARVGAGTGVSGGSADYSAGFDGNWSYYLGSKMTGHPANCSVDMDQEVGARNAAAPPWEGRMIAFGPPNAADSSVRNQWIQEVLLSTRPYGATPIAGQLDDARQFLWNDTSTDPLDSTEQFGPTNDPNWRIGSCRKTIMILLTDGEPNLDLRPFCEEEASAGVTAGRCPYEKPEDIVSSLRLSAPTPSMAVETFVVGFALSQVTPAGSSTPISCSDLTDTMCSDPQNNLPDATESKNIQACCTLNKIAAAGGEDENGDPRKAYFAADRAQLKTIFTDILDDVIQIATRTMPVLSSPGGDSSSQGFKFFSAFDPRPDPTEPKLWEGILERSRFVCSDSLVPERRYEPDEGDDFAANLNSGSGPSRRFYSVVGDDSRNSMRPFITADTDGVGLGTGVEVAAASPAALKGVIPATAMQVTGPTCPGSAANADACRDLIIDHLVGTNATGPSRCDGGGCSLFGGIYHSVPVTVPGRPSELLRDESYEEFVAKMGRIVRPSVLYTSTVDGFLHAFNVAPFPGSTGADDRRVKAQLNNEIWAFLPPAVLPVLQTQYPDTPAVLLDGLPIIKDVVATETGTGASAVLQSYERIQDDAVRGGGAWRTVLVQGFGSGQVPGGYFALDITEPDRTDTAPDDREEVAEDKPTFRWQLTRTATGTPLFGSGGTPLITTVFIDQLTGGPREVAVAVLPGGDAAPGAGSTTAIGSIMDTDPAEFKTARNVRNYPGAEHARSLTIVRLDTGAIIRTFRPSTGAAPFATGVFTATEIPAPITGQPKAYPELTGAVADRIYVGDRDGRMWRVDVSSQNPANWNMQVFYDAFEDGTVTSSQPVTLPPVLSVDEVGDVTVAFATGSQELDNTDNRVISLTETIATELGVKKFVTHVNWIHELGAGHRVTGPMVLFNRGLFYAASRPPQTTGNACDVGSSTIYSAHYIESDDYAEAIENDDEPDPTSGPAPAPQFSTLEFVSQPGLIYGVSLEQEPTCLSEEVEIDGNDSFGYGDVNMSKTINPGKYFLSYAASGNTTNPRGVLNTQEELPAPQLPVRFDSWAVVYE